MLQPMAQLFYCPQCVLLPGNRVSCVLYLYGLLLNIRTSPFNTTKALYLSAYCLVCCLSCCVEIIVIPLDGFNQFVFAVEVVRLRCKAGY